MSRNRKERNYQTTTKRTGDWRIYTLLFFVCLIFLIILVRLFSLQILSSEKYESIADGQYKIFKKLNPNRGNVYLKNHNDVYPLAINRDLNMIYVVPREMEDQEYLTSKLSEILNLEKSFVSEKVSNREDVFEIIKRKVSDEDAGKIKDLKIKGVYVTPESFRYYPAGKLASHLIGFVGFDGKEYSGRYGIESYWDKDLRGEAGELNQESDAGGRWISIADRDFKPAKNGSDLVLTIEYTVQYEVEKILKEAVEKHNADSGSIVVMDPKTGRILAMAGYPDFDPNEYSKVEDMSVFINPAISDAYESGSVFKTFTVAAGIDDGKINPSSTYIDTGIVKEAGYEIMNSDEKAYGEQTMTQVLEKSLNTGVIYIERLLGNSKFLGYVQRFGFGEKTGVDLSGESAGSIDNLNFINRDIQFFTASYGQGITTTPLQLASAYSAIANGGILMKPQIVEKIIYQDKTEKEVEPQEIRRVIREDTAKSVSEILRSVIVNGHGQKADVKGYLVGGKTGTAQVAKKDSGGYEEGITIGSFTGFAPVNDPMFTIAVEIVNPKDVIWAESSAAPVFGRVMEFLLDYYNVKPTEL